MAFGGCSLLENVRWRELLSCRLTSVIGSMENCFGTSILPIVVGNPGPYAGPGSPLSDRAACTLPLHRSSHGADVLLNEERVDERHGDGA